MFKLTVGKGLGARKCGYVVGSRCGYKRWREDLTLRKTIYR